MNILIFSIKNILFRWWRSLSIGFFIFLSAVMMLFFYSFIDTIKQKINNVVINGITGHIQIRSDRSFEQDMVEIYHKNWSSISAIYPETVTKIKKILNESFNTVRYYSLVRYIAYLHSNNDKKNERSLLIGIEPDFIKYKESFRLIEGRYLSGENSNEIIITAEQAKELNLHVGEEILITTKSTAGLTVEKKFIVVGIGEFLILSFFSYKASYTDIRTLQDFISVGNDEISDLIIYLPEKSNLKTVIKRIKKTFELNQIESELTSEEKIKSADIKVKYFDFSDIDKTSKKIKISSYTEMGKMFKSASQIIFLIINILFIIFLIIISLLITNMVVLITIERFYEIGIFRAIGFSRFYVVLVFISEIIITTIFSTLLGLISGTLLISFVNNADISSSVSVIQILLGEKLSLLLKPSYFIIIFLTINIFSFLSSFLPVYKACSVKPVEFLRNN